jgi:hypothetical protein
MIMKKDKLEHEGAKSNIAKPLVTCRFFSRIFRCYIMGMHDWTCKASEGIPPTKEELETGIKGFNAYAKMYCKCCHKISKLSL